MSKHLEHRSRKCDHGVAACALKHPEVLVPRICSRAIRKHVQCSRAPLVTRESSSSYHVLLQGKVVLVASDAIVEVIKHIFAHRNVPAKVVHE